MKKLISLFVLSLILFLSSCSEPLVVQSCAPISALDTVIDITFYNVDNYNTHYNKVKSIYHEVNRVASDFEPNYNNTSVYDLNLNRTIEGSDLLIDIINNAVSLMEETDGYYNPFIGRIARLWKNTIETKIIPSDDTIKNELDIVKFTSVTIEGNTIKLNGDGNLDLGGIAKGYATQKACEYLASNNVTSFILNAGQSNIVFGDKNGSNFNVGLIDPNTNRNFAFIKGINKIISTSSHQYQGVTIDNNFYHHLINPFTGYPVNYFDSVNVLCDNSMYADVYSTAFFVMEEAKIKEFIKDKNIKTVLYKGSNIIFENLGEELYA